MLATEVVSSIDVPPLDNSQMDGYAVRTLDVPGVPTTLRVSQRIAAGQVGVPLEPGTAARIFTGAPIPRGSGCGDHAGEVRSRRRQRDVERDGRRVVKRFAARASTSPLETVVLCAGTRLRPQHCALAASVGAARLTVYRRLRVATLLYRR